jgi:MFS transporter, DHA1 family, multidrug resistance protein
MPTPASDTSKPNAPVKLVVILAVASSLAPLSMDFFAPAMPSATRELGLAKNAVQSTLYLFLAGYAVAPFLWGMLADRAGRKKVMLAGLSVYIAASAGCFLSSDLATLSLMRLLQGVGAASGVVLARTVLRDIHGPEGATKAIYNMYRVMIWIPITAPIFGGYLSLHFSWRLSFLVMAMVATVTFVGWYSILRHPDFVRNALANTFCITSMLLFLANYSFLAEKHYQVDASGSGFILAVFNASLTLGVLTVRFIVPRLGVENSVRFGLALALTGWLSLLILNLAIQAPVSALLPISLACIGTGIVISLTIGQALIPFTFNAGTASALFICMQSGGASLISFTVSQTSESTLISISLLIACSSLLALMSMLFIRKSS